MLLNAGLLDCTPGSEQALCFFHEIDLSGLRRWGMNPFPAPVTVRGELKADKGGLRVSYTADYLLCTVCSRCLAPIEQRRSEAFEHPVCREGEFAGDDDCVLTSDDMLDLEGMTASDLSLLLEAVPLCDPNCKGLCQECGSNRNIDPCDCENRATVDPRFAGLALLIDGDREA